MSGDVLSVEEVHQRTGLSTHAIRRAIRRGELRASKIANRVVVRVADYDAWFDDNVIKPVESVPPSGSVTAPRSSHGRGSLARLKAIEGGPRP